MVVGSDEVQKAGNDRSFTGSAVAAGSGDAAPLRILHVDDACIIVDKPAGRLCVPGRGPLAENSVAQQLQTAFADALVVHRLDMATSGVMLFGRGAVWQRHFSIEFAERRVAKRYVALVSGRPDSSSGEIDLPLSADWPNRPRQRVDSVGGKPSITRWRRIGAESGIASTRLELTPITGRSHQLRVHLLAIGHPIIGDALYAPVGSGQSPSRLMLHAHSIAFLHPQTHNWLTVESAVPF